MSEFSGIDVWDIDMARNRPVAPVEAPDSPEGGEGAEKPLSCPVCGYKTLMPDGYCQSCEAYD